MDRSRSAHVRVKDLANRLANARMRKEILPRLRQDVPADLQHGWNPWEEDPAPVHAHSMKTTDKLVFEVMRDDGLRAEARDMIHEETVTAAFFSRETPEFIAGVLEDLLGVSESPTYEKYDG